MKKMKELSQGARIKTLRESLGKTQKDFARMLEVKQGTVSAWERDDPDRRPSDDMLIRIGGFCENPADTIYFWGKAGFTESALIAAADKIAKDRTRPRGDDDLVYVPKLSEEKDVNHKAGIWLPWQFFPKHVLPRLIIIDEQSAGNVFKTGDVLVLERNEGNPVNPEPFADEIVVVRHGEYGVWKQQIHKDSDAGRIELGLLKFGRDPDFPMAWSWELLPISARHRPELESRGGALDNFVYLFNQEMPLPEKGTEAWDAAEREIEAKARSQSYLHEWKILGRFLGWFRSPGKQKLRSK